MRDIRERFKPHWKLLGALRSGWDRTILGQSLVKLLRVYREDRHAIVWDGFARDGAGWVKVRVKAYADNPVVHFWFSPGYGGTHLSAPTFPRQALPFNETTDLALNVAIDDGLSGGDALHGQGVCLRYREYNFDTEEWIKGSWKWAMTPTPYAPSYGNKTGGNWAYMGLTHPDRPIEEWRNLLYPLGNMPGAFVHEDGRWVTEQDYPNVLGAGHLEHRGTERGWIKYTDPDNPWHDRAASDPTGQEWTHPDDQHLAQYDAVAQAYLTGPQRDEGMALLLERGAHTFLRMEPGRDKGTTHEEAGQERAQGRLLKTGAWLFRAHKAVELANDPLRYGTPHGIQDAIALRVAQIFAKQVQAAAYFKGQNGVPFTPFDTDEKDSIAPHEVGIHYWGLSEVKELLVEYGQDVAELDGMMWRCEKYCFDAFRQWPH